MLASIGPRTLKLLWSWSYKHLHLHVTVRCHQGILWVLLNLRPSQCKGFLLPDLLRNYGHCSKLWAGPSERNFEGTCLTKCRPTVWVLHRVWLWYLMNPAIYIGRVLSQFQARWRGWYIAWCRWFPQKEQKDLVPLTRVHVIKIILVVPATNASSEYAFNALRRVKSYLRTTTSIILWHAQFIRSWWRN